jgi:MtN3 and saliva related transmembrane protein
MRSAKEISLQFVAAFTVGIGFWLAYGIAYGLTVVILWNSIALVLGIAMLYAKVRWG